MTAVALTSLRGAPGATTASLLLAGCAAYSVLVEADLSGGSIATRFGLGREPGLTTIAGSRAAQPLELADHCQCAGGVMVLVGPDNPATAASLWKRGGAVLGDNLRAANVPIIIDLGRWRNETSQPARIADLVLVLLEPVAEQLVLLTHVLPEIRHASGANVGLVLVGDGPYSSTDIESAFGLSVFGRLPFDRVAAESLRTGGSARRLARSPLARSVHTLHNDVRAWAVDSEQRAAS